MKLFKVTHANGHPTNIAASSMEQVAKHYEGVKSIEMVAEKVMILGADAFNLLERLNYVLQQNNIISTDGNGHAELVKELKEFVESRLS